VFQSKNDRTIAAGLKEVEEVLKTRKNLEGKMPQSSLENSLCKSVESRTGGNLDMKNSDKKQTNGKGMNGMQNFSKVTYALLGMYPSEHELHHWMEVHVVAWNTLECFLES